MNYHILTYSGATPGESGEECGTEYSFEYACEACGTGAELSGNLKVRGITKIKKDFFETINGDCIISQTLKESIKKKFPEFDVKPVADTKNQTSDFFHLYTSTTLPNFKETSTGYVKEDQCPICHRNGYYNDVIIGQPTIVEPLNFKYDINDISRYSNEIILKTWECRGLSNKVKSGNKVVRFARPWIVVREDLKEVLESERVKNIHFEQIKIEAFVQHNL